MDLVNSKTALIEGQNTLLSEECIIFLLDVSGSMSSYLSYKDTSIPSRTKIRALSDAVIGFVEQRIQAINKGSKDTLGILTFGSSRSRTGVDVLHTPGNKNLEGLIMKLSSLRGGGSTPMAEAVREAAQLTELMSVGLIRVVIVSDGFPDSTDSTLDIVKYSYNELGIIFDTIGIGNKGNNNSVDEDFLTRIATLGGGSYTYMSSPEELLDMFLRLEAERQLLLGSGIRLLPENC